MPTLTLRHRPGGQRAVYDNVTGDYLYTEYVEPQDFAEGDQNSATFTEAVRAEMELQPFIFLREAPAGSLWRGTDLLDPTTETFPDELVAQRGYITYESDYPIQVSVQEGDGAAIWQPFDVLFPATSSPSTVLIGELDDFFLTHYGTLHWHAPDAPEGYAIKVYEWWLETDIDVPGMSGRVLRGRRHFEPLRRR